MYSKQDFFFLQYKNQFGPLGRYSYLKIVLIIDPS